MEETDLDRMLSIEMGGKVVVVPGVKEIALTLQRFRWPDYVSFITMLVVCIFIGVYFGFYQTSTSAQEYLIGNKKMKLFPIVVSLVASYISGISLLGVPTETYLYGTQYLYIIGGLILMTFLINYIYLPVFYNLNITTTYEYLEKRFDRNVRAFASFLFVFDLIVWLPLVIYVPALTFNLVTGINVHIITPIVCLICIFYTSLGGVRAVVWTDVIQALIMVGAIILVAVKGTIDIGGASVVFERNLATNRIEAPNLDFNPSVRYTLWSLTIGGSIYLLQSACINQTMIQRYLSLPCLHSAKKATWFFTLGVTFIVALGNYGGLLIYATFHKCDPLSTKLAKEKDQLFPLLVMQVFGDYPGMTGIFVAGVLSASLSSLSTGLNAMAAVTLKDFYSFFSSKTLTDKQAALLMKSTVVIFGTICVGFVYIIEHLGSVLQVMMSLGSVASGPSLGLFTIGILLPWVNAKGALIGGISSLICMLCLGFKAQISKVSGDLLYPEKHLTTEGCHYHFIPSNSPVVGIHINASSSAAEEPFIFFHISYLWYTLIGTLITAFVAVSVSFMTQPLDPRDVDPALLASCIKKYIKPREFPNEPVDGIIYAFDTNKEDDVNENSKLHEAEKL